jgi:hypothetical protein
MPKFRFAQVVTLALVLPAALASCSSDDTPGGGAPSGGSAGSAGNSAQAGAGGRPSSGGGGGTAPGSAGSTASAGLGGATGESTGGAAGALGEAAGGAAGDNAEGGAGGASDGPPLTELSCSDAAALPIYPGGISIRLLNATAAPLFFGKTSAECGYHFGVTMESADQKPLKPFLDDCDHSCGSLQQSGGCACQPECVQIVTQIDPGKYYEVGWTGTVFDSVAMPKSCYVDQSCGTTACWHEVLAATPITFSADLYSDKTCSTGSCFNCTTGSTGTCTVIGGSTVSGTKHTATMSWTGDHIATLTFN